MSIQLYREISREVKRHVSPSVSESSRDRLAMMVTGIIGSESSSPARIARAVYRSQLSAAQPESIERRVRRTENDPQLTPQACFEPMAKAWLAARPMQRAILIVDPTTQDDRVVKISVAIWYRGRSLPLVWDVYPANEPLKGPGFWERIDALLSRAANLLPAGIDVLALADRAFGTPRFTDLIEQRGWYYIVRVQGQTRWRDQQGVERRIDRLVQHRRQRAHRKGEAFKGRGWRPARVVVYWGRREKTPLCLVTNLPLQVPAFTIIRLYRRRYAIEATFRDEKRSGWHWEDNQVVDLDHTRRLLVAMALAIWLAIGVGTQVARECLAQPVTPRSTRPSFAKYSLFTLGKQRLLDWFHGVCSAPLTWTLEAWDAPNWSSHAWAAHRYVFVFTDFKILKRHFDPVRP